jgi:3-isopropylmalate dehydrogenase
VAGLFEPSHGSSPHRTGTDTANPAATILSAAMMLRWSLGEDGAASALETAVRATLHAGIRTNDVLGSDAVSAGRDAVGTQAFADAVAERVGAVEVAA